PPLCHRCGRRSERFLTRRSNRKGNANRPFYKCQRCDKFLCFADRRGNIPDNPSCHCGASSKQQLAGREKKVPRGVHFVCRLGECDFYQPHFDRSGRQVTVDDDDLVRRFAELGFL
ncbi:uncharacterized protein C8A04DRAFT_14705, partial [Dichotomopilus funicola]